MLRLQRAKKDDSTNAQLMSELHSIVCDEYNALMANSLVTSLENTVEVWYKTLLNWDYDYCWFAFDGETLVGWVECHSVRDNAGWLTIYVRRDCQGKGYGREILRLYEDECFRKLGLRRLFLSVLDYNTRAKELYKSAVGRKQAFIRVKWSRVVGKNLYDEEKPQCQIIDGG